MSLRRRVLFGCLAVAAVLLVAGAVLTATFRGFLVGRVDERLRQVARPLAGNDRFRGFPPPGSGVGDEPRDFFTELYLGILGPRDDSVSRLGPRLGDEELPPPELSATAVRDRAVPFGADLDPFTVPAVEGGGSWRVAAVSRSGAGDVLVVGISLTDAAATLRRIMLVEAAASAAVLAALAAVAVWVLRLGVRPLTEMAETAEHIAAGDLSRRIERAGGRTEAGQLGSALNAMLEQIEEAFRAKGASEDRLRRFVADASHELRTPLTSIRGYAELWRQGGLGSTEELTEAMRRMENEAARMGALVDDLLLLARLDEGRPLERAPVDLARLVADAVADAGAVEPQRPIDLVSGPAVVSGDELRLRQVVANLLANARVHTPPETPVHVAVGTRDGSAHLEVADEGPGVPPELADHVFERFIRGDPSRTRASGGTGLGLSIVAAIVEAHGGRVGLATAPGAGARFSVDLPLLAEMDPS